LESLRIGSGWWEALRWSQAWLAGEDFVPVIVVGHLNVPPCLQDIGAIKLADNARSLKGAFKCCPIAAMMCMQAAWDHRRRPRNHQLGGAEVREQRFEGADVYRGIFVCRGTKMQEFDKDVVDVLLPQARRLRMTLQRIVNG
jgi:hypothetical protein